MLDIISDISQLFPCEECGIEEFCPPKLASSWRKFPDHKSEIKAVKEALRKAGIEAEVGHGRGTAWGWLEINIGDPRMRNGLKAQPFEYQYTEEEQALHNKVLKIAQEHPELINRKLREYHAAV
jgi:hypothetical protein